MQGGEPAFARLFRYIEAVNDAAVKPRHWPLNAIVSGIVGIILVATTAAMIVLWPQADQITQESGLSESGQTVVSAEVLSVAQVTCDQPGILPTDPSQTSVPEPGADERLCQEVRAELSTGVVIRFPLNESQAEVYGLRSGDQVKLIEYTSFAGADTGTIYAFYEYPRGGKMLFLAILFVIIVIAVGRWRGARALVGVAAAILLLTTFILPAILAGEPPVLVASVGAIGIMIVVLYLAHGVSHRTTSALFGSIFGIAFTAIAGLATTQWLRFSGVASTEEGSLRIAVPGLQMNEILTATIVIAGLGVLNDITVAQASAVWEMRELNPHLSKRRIYLSAMRVGRDHIASSIYTLVFAYAGAMLIVLLLLYTYPRDLIELMTSEQIGQELIRTLIGSAGLVLSMPVTTAFAVMFAAPAKASEATPTPEVGIAPQ